VRTVEEEVFEPETDSSGTALNASNGAPWGAEVYVGRLASLSVTRHALRDKFGQFGKLTYLRLFNRGVAIDAFAHVGFTTPESAWQAIQHLNGITWLGQVVTVQPLVR
jgi:RNA recognition motif-containing protein